MSYHIQTQAPWHFLALNDLKLNLGSTEKGLSKEESAKRLVEYGPNQLPQKPPVPLWTIVLRQFQSPLIYVLALAAIVSLATGDVKDAAFIAAVLVLNALIGAYQEWKAEQSSSALRKLLQIRASVYRDGEIEEVGAEEIVPGDLVVIESGNRVPADIRLLSTHALEIDESLLSGESLPVLKDPAWSGAEATQVSDRLNMVFAGSVVSRGRGKGLVVATGTATSVGQLALDVLDEESGKPPLLMRMERFTRVIAISVLTAALVIGLLGATLGGYSVSEMFMFSVAVAVSAIPEGLPVAMTVALAIATTRMARRGLIVRRLTAVEGLGSCTLIATDKTGTLTCNELTLREILLPNGERFQTTGEGFVPNGEVLSNNGSIEPSNYEPLMWLARASILCNEADLHRHADEWVWRGDAVDLALLSFASKLGHDIQTSRADFPQVTQIPFEPEHQYAATYNSLNNTTAVFVKGAFERVLSMCNESIDSEFERDTQEAAAIRLAEQGYRVLALADGIISEPLHPDEAPPVPNNLRFLGLVGMIDPLRPGAKEAVRSCAKAGISVTMITGDHRVTAFSIARDLGLTDDISQVMTGAELLETTPDELSLIVSRIRVFARVAPHQKLQIVEAAKKAGHFVAVTGDGVNDAPALRVANIGVAMGRSGTDVAREAAELVIADDNFAA